MKIEYTLEEVRELMITVLAEVIESFDDYHRGPSFATEQAIAETNKVLPTKEQQKLQESVDKEIWEILPILRIKLGDEVKESFVYKELVKLGYDKQWCFTKSQTYKEFEGLSNEKAIKILVKELV